MKENKQERVLVEKKGSRMRGGDQREGKNVVMKGSKENGERNRKSGAEKECLFSECMYVCELSVYCLTLSAVMSISSAVV